MSGPIDIDVVIVGGGAAGLWLLDELRRRDIDALLLEAFDLGSGQTIASQGIIHGGLKYTLTGLFTPAARAIKDMPLTWRRCLAGEAQPDLSACRLRAEFCYLWRTSSIGSRLAMIGARAGLRVRPGTIERSARPAVLANVPGTVARLDEQVIEPASLLEVLASRNRSRILRIEAESGLEFAARNGAVDLVRLINPVSGEPLDLRPRHVVFLAGGGNEKLREMAGLPRHAMQRRPLHMVMARGDVHHLPELNGHCVDGTSTRVTITSTMDFTERRVWQIGGQIAESGIALDRRALVERAADEVREAIPGINLAGVEWSTYQVDRAEAASGGARPEDARMVREGNIITGWPTKLALVPKLVEETPKRLNVKTSKESVEASKQSDEAKSPDFDVSTFRRFDVSHWPRPAVALPPWETEQEWFSDL